MSIFFTIISVSEENFTLISFVSSHLLCILTSLQDCPPGNYCPDTVSAPRACPTGSYSAGGTSQCLTCPAGHACDSNSRMECDEGTWSPTNSTYCRPCNPGYLCLAEDAPHSSPNAYPCQAGGYCDGKVRFECPDGMFGNQQGKATLAEACQECPAGNAIFRPYTPSSSNWLSFGRTLVCFDNDTDAISAVLLHN